MRFLLQILTWWNGQTLGTRLHTWLRGKNVGEDEFGNRYYESTKGRRWVIFAGDTEASRIPPSWHGWLHYSYDNRPGHEELARQEWEIPHQENQTGTPNAYAPDGSEYADGQATKAYEAWTPTS